jgi:hypothetical protein
MGILWLFDTCGLIVGPAIWAAGLFAIWRCIRASRRSSSLYVRRSAAIYALLPLAVGICGALFGVAMLLAATQPAGLARNPWLDLAKVCLAGFVVTCIPLIWSLMLLSQRRDVA